tara:strand:- start:137 stop:490 length:354 start_codon:yes stop_codon:yes gene_type:complete
MVTVDQVETLFRTPLLVLQLQITLVLLLLAVAVAVLVLTVAVVLVKQVPLVHLLRTLVGQQVLHEGFHTKDMVALVLQTTGEVLPQTHTPSVMVMVVAAVMVPMRVQQAPSVTQTDR